MKLAVATNWDEALIEQLLEYKVDTIFGAMDETPLGGGRPSLLLAKVDKEHVEDYVKRVHSVGMRFHYLLNAPCMNNMEYDRKIHRELVDHINWLNSIDVDGVVVSIPLIMEIVKEQFSSMEVRVSVINHVNSVQRAQLFEELGADSITLDFNINRDFKLIRKIREAVKCKLVILVNDGCLYQCPSRYYHYNIIGHASQTINPLKGFYIDYCIIRCTMKRLSNIAEFMKSRWIRPEDMHLYEECGIETFKISGRRMSTKWMTNVVKAYHSRKYEGNLADLLNISQLGVDPDMCSPQYRSFLSKAENIKQEKILQIGQLYPVKPYIDNKELNGFINFFKEQNCLAGCGNCDYCQKWADKVVRISKEDVSKYISVVSALLKDLKTSRVFEREDSNRIKEEGITWNDEVKNLMNEIIHTSTPEEFKDIALMTISNSAKQNAKARGSTLIEKEDMIKAFLTDTPSIFQRKMRATLRSKGIYVEKEE